MGPEVKSAELGKLKIVLKVSARRRSHPISPTGRVEEMHLDSKLMKYLKMPYRYVAQLKYQLISLKTHQATVLTVFSFLNYV